MNLRRWEGSTRVFFGSCPVVSPLFGGRVSLQSQQTNKNRLPQDALFSSGHWASEFFNVCCSEQLALREGIAKRVSRP